MKTRREIYQGHFRRYQEAGKRGKGKILDEVHVPASYGKQGRGETGGGPKVRRKRSPGKRGGRPPEYQEPAFIGVLTRIWEDHGRPCGKLFSVMIPGDD